LGYRENCLFYQEIRLLTNHFWRAFHQARLRAAVERATNISGGVCLNPVVGISYELPKDMKAEDASALRKLAYRGSA
jgi:hypothetical protein